MGWVCKKKWLKLEKGSDDFEKIYESEPEHKSY